MNEWINKYLSPVIYLSFYNIFLKVTIGESNVFANIILVWVPCFDENMAIVSFPTSALSLTMACLLLAGSDAGSSDFSMALSFFFFPAVHYLCCASSGQKIKRVLKALKV